MNIVFSSVFIIAAWGVLLYALMLFPKAAGRRLKVKDQHFGSTDQLSKAAGRQNGMIWLPLCLLGCECWFALLSGVYSLVRIPVSAVSIGTASLVCAAALILYSQRTHIVQVYYWKRGDIALAFVVAAIAAGFFLYRFCGEYVIAYATNDAADRLSAAMHIVTERTAIYTWPNMYFGHTANAMFIEALKPLLPGNLYFRAFEIKDVFNLWLGGMLFHAALRRYPGKDGVFFVLTILYVLAFPLSNALFGFNYLGISIGLIILLQIASHMLMEQDVNPKIALLMISFACFGVGASYTLFAPPVFISAFCIVSFYVFSVRRAAKAFLPTQFAVFAWPAALTFIYAVLVDREGQIAVGEQLAKGGATYFNLISDFLPYLPFAVIAVIALFKYASRGKGICACTALPQPFIFFGFQAVFLVRYLTGLTSEYYYSKFNYAAWFFILLLTGIGIAAIFSKPGFGRGAARLLAVYAACWLLLAAFTLPPVARLQQEYAPLPKTLDTLSSPLQIYAYNIYCFSKAEAFFNYYDTEFVELCEAAYRLKKEQGISSFYTNAVETVTEVFATKMWVDVLVNERINVGAVGRSAGNDMIPDRNTLPKTGARIWVVPHDSFVYMQNRKYIDSFPRYFENGSGFVIIVESGDDFY